MAATEGLTIQSNMMIYRIIWQTQKITIQDNMVDINS